MFARIAHAAASLGSTSALADDLAPTGFYLDGGTSTPTGGSEPFQFKYGYPYVGGFLATR